MTTLNKLTKQQLIALRNEITLNSLFTRDYENSLGVSTSECVAFFDGYVESLCALAPSDMDFFDIVDKYDTPENLYSYWCEIFA